MKVKKISEDQNLKIHLMKWCIDKCIFEYNMLSNNQINMKMTTAKNLYEFILKETSK